MFEKFIFFLIIIMIIIIMTFQSTHNDILFSIDKMLFLMTEKKKRKDMVDVLNYLCNIYIKSLTYICRQIRVMTLIDRFSLTRIERSDLLQPIAKKKHHY